jgi:hypothetical protein
MWEKLAVEGPLGLQRSINELCIQEILKKRTSGANLEVLFCLTNPINVVMMTGSLASPEAVHDSMTGIRSGHERVLISQAVLWHH